MADVRLTLGGRNYIVTSPDGEEENLRRAEKLLSEKFDQAHAMAPGLNEMRHFLFASLMLADEMLELRGRLAEAEAQLAAAARPPAASQGEAQLAMILDNLAERVETLATSLENAGVENDAAES